MTSTVCLIAKNEISSIAEWIAYQTLIGFDRITIYDNGSTDGTSQLIHRIAKCQASVTYHYWPDVPGQRPQQTAYADAVAKCDTDWIAFFDTDEFLVLKNHVNVNEYLASMPADASAVAINWLLFGSSGQLEKSPGLVIERFTRCAFATHVKNNFIKTIARPNAVQEIFVHSATLKFGYYVNGSGHPIDVGAGQGKIRVVDLANAQLNHYLLKSRAEFHEKCARGDAAKAEGAPGKTDNRAGEDYWDAHDANHTTDNAISPMVEVVKGKLANWCTEKIQQLDSL